MSNSKQIKLEEEEGGGDYIEVNVEYIDDDALLSPPPAYTSSYHRRHDDISGVEKIIYGSEEFLVMPVKPELENDEINLEQQNRINDSNENGLGLGCNKNGNFVPLKIEVVNVNNDDDVVEDYCEEYSEIENFNKQIITVYPNKYKKPNEKIDLIGKNGHIWSSMKKSNENIGKFIPKTIPLLRSLTQPEDIFCLYFPEKMINKIVENTNIFLNQQQAYTNGTTTKTGGEFEKTDILEINALLGLLVISGAMNANHMSIGDLFDPLFGTNIFKCAFTQTRFQLLQNSLHFENPVNIEKLQKSMNDPFAAIRSTWEEFITICRESFSPGSTVTVGEHHLPMTGRCPFKKLNSTGSSFIKLMIICDSKTKYMFDAIPNTFRGTQKKCHSNEWVKKLTKSIHGTMRNVTVSNWPVSVALALELIAPPYKLSIVGPTPDNQTALPDCIKQCKSKQTATSTICSDSETGQTILAYRQETVDLTLLVSTLHHGATIKPPEPNMEPEILTFYNDKKLVINAFDSMCKQFSCSRIVGLWPLCIFHGMVNIACVNSYIIYLDNMQQFTKRLLGKKDFMKRIAQELIKPHIRRKRTHQPKQSQSIEETIQTILIADDIRNYETDTGDNRVLEPGTSASSFQQQQEQDQEKRTICKICPSKRRRMTLASCKKCRKPYCREHRSNCCSECGC